MNPPKPSCNDKTMKVPGNSFWISTSELTSSKVWSKSKTTNGRGFDIFGGSRNSNSSKNKTGIEQEPKRSRTFKRKTDQNLDVVAPARRHRISVTGWFEQKIATFSKPNRRKWSPTKAVAVPCYIVVPSRQHYIAGFLTHFWAFGNIH